MNIFLLSLINKSIGGALIKFSQLPVQSSLLSTAYQGILARLTETIIDTYIRFFRSVNIVPVEFGYYKDSIVKILSLVEIDTANMDSIEKKLVDLIETPLVTSIIPVNVHLHQPGRLFWYLGIGVLESTHHSAEFFIHKFSLNTASIYYSPGSLHYLDNILDDDSLSKSISPRELAAKYGKNYNQFQKDCREYFGDTFHRFHNKMKMLDAVGDILFTSYSLKEIAYRNDFFNYNSMYILFRKKYNFPIDSIPRLLSEI